MKSHYILTLTIAGGLFRGTPAYAQDDFNEEEQYYGSGSQRQEIYSYDRGQR